ALGRRRAQTQRTGAVAARVVAAPACVARGALRARARGEPRRAFPSGLPGGKHGFRRDAYRRAARPRSGARAMELTGFDVRTFLAEDVGDGDLTTDAVVPADATLDAALLLKQEGVVCGLEVAEAVFRELDPNMGFEPLVRD